MGSNHRLSTLLVVDILLFSRVSMAQNKKLTLHCLFHCFARPGFSVRSHHRQSRRTIGNSTRHARPHGRHGRPNEFVHGTITIHVDSHGSLSVLEITQKSVLARQTSSGKTIASNRALAAAISTSTVRWHDHLYYAFTL